MNIQQNISLKKYNTFGIDVKAKRFVCINSLSDLKKLIKTEKELFLLGEGSNILLTSNIAKTVVYINTKGIIVNDSIENEVLVTAEAGENWHEFVLWCISQNYGGLENLSFIPGKVGTSPIQNIGAYGVEMKDCFYSLEALELATGKIATFKKEDCNFDYRNSVFKKELKGKYVIVNVTFKLTKQNHQLHIDYGNLQSELKNIKNPTLKDVSDAVIAIRKRKLPNPKEIGNSGSFFKNPVVSTKLFKEIQQKYPEMPFYVISDNEVKIPAGWLIEQCGFKGKRIGDAGVHQKQALVLVNYGNTSGQEIYDLAKQIQHKVKETFFILLEMEVNII